MRTKLQWNEGAPEVMREGMVIQNKYGIHIVGSLVEEHTMICLRWAWIVTPYEMDWIREMNKPR